ncbi:hypothetical protein Anae109_3829 [Anaeromyxobacter sp. Fw109-5]|nr:hypothetical protein Anae109_3829 [Anaeromyxobacter sp. Fw109-5]
MSTARVVADVPLHRARARRHDLLVGATVAGVLAGGAAMAWVAASAALAGLPSWRPLAVVAVTLLGEEAANGGAGPVLGGLLLWTGVSTALALGYAAIVPRDFSFASSALVGVAYSFVVMALMTTTVLPRVNALMRAEMAEIGGAWVIAYAVYGLGLGLVPRLRRRWLAM